MKDSVDLERSEQVHTESSTPIGVRLSAGETPDSNARVAAPNFVRLSHARRPRWRAYTAPLLCYVGKRCRYGRATNIALVGATPDLVESLIQSSAGIPLGGIMPTLFEISGGINAARGSSVSPVAFVGAPFLESNTTGASPSPELGGRAVRELR